MRRAGYDLCAAFFIVNKSKSFVNKVPENVNQVCQQSLEVLTYHVYKLLKCNASVTDFVDAPNPQKYRTFEHLSTKSTNISNRGYELGVTGRTRNA